MSHKGYNNDGLLTSSLKMTGKLMGFGLKTSGKAALWAGKKAINLDINTGSSWMSKSEMKKAFPRHKKGLILDGKGNHCLPAPEMYRHIAVLGSVGSGKTSGYFLGALLNLIEQKASSVVVLDIAAGALYNQTSAYAARMGMRVERIAPARPEESAGFNLFTGVDLSGIAEVISDIVTHIYDNPSDAYWSTEAEIILRSLAKTLKIKEAQDQDNCLTLHQILYLLQNMLIRLDDVTGFVRFYADQSTLNEYLAFINKGSSKLLSSVISTAISIVQQFSTEKLAQFEQSTIDFASLRKNRTIIYIQVPINSSFYSFIVNQFFSRLLNSLFQQHPQPNDLDIHFLCDELTNLGKIKDLESYILVSRQFRVAFSVGLQSVLSLKKVYGDGGMELLSGGFASKLIYGGFGDLDSLEMFSRLTGIQRTHKFLEDPRKDEYIRPLISPDELRQLDGKALLLSANRKAALLDITPHYKIPSLLRKTQIPPFNYSRNLKPLRFINL